MQKVRRRGCVLFLVFAMLAAWCIPAEANTNTLGIEFTAELDQSTVSVADSGKTVKMTIRSNKPVRTDSLGYRVSYDPEALALTKIEGNGDNITITDRDVNYDKGIVVWTFEDDPVTTDTWSVITFTVRDGAAAGTYPVGVYQLTLSDDWGRTVIERDGSASAVLTITDAAAEPQEPEFVSQSLLLNGRIGVNFFMNLPEIEGVDYNESYMEYTVCGKTWKVGFDAENRSENGEAYGFLCTLNAIQMADTIDAVFHYGDGKTVEKTYSAAEYVASFREHASEYDAKTADLIDALADYGHYIQPFLAEGRDWTVGVEHAEMPAARELTDTDIANAEKQTEKYSVQREIGDAQLDQITFSLYLDSDTAIYLYLKGKAGYTGAVDARVGGDSAASAVKQKDGRYRVAITNIPAYQFAKTWKIGVTAGSETEVQVSVLSYIHAMLTTTLPAYRDNADARKAMTALYRYYEAAQAYI